MISIWFIIIMNITIDSTQNTLPLSFDLYGNVYIGSDYQLNVTGKNEPYLEKGDYFVIDNINKKIKKNQLIFQTHLLKDKIKEQTDEYNSDEESDEIDYYPENTQEYIDSDSEECIDGDNQSIYGHSNIPFNFWHNFTENIVTEKNDGDVMALYDVYVYDNVQLLFKSVSKDNSSIYIVKIHTDGNLFFRPIGSKETKHRVQMNNNLLEIITLQ